MAILTVGATSSYPTIAAAMLAAAPGDIIQLESGYSNETATVTHEGITIFGDATSTGIVIQIGAGVATFTLTGDAPINVLDAVDGEGIVGNAGDNVITVASGSDAVDGGLGIDRLIVDYRLAVGAVTGDSTSNFTEAGGGGRTVTITNGTIEHFTVLTGAGADTITTGDGDDIINTGEGAGTVTAGQGANVITGGSGADTITALDGGNIIHGGDGANVLTSGDGDDIFTSGVDADTIVAGGGDDHITVLGGADTVASGAGNDTLVVDYSARVTNVIGGVTGGNLGTGYTGAISDQTVHSVGFNTTENFIVTTGSGNDSITTGDGVDSLSGGAGDDVLDAGGGDDILRGGAGVDTLIGRGGIDTADYAAAAGEVTASLTTGLASNDGDGGRDGFSGIENLIGSAFNDGLTGNGAANTLSGGAGDDVLSGLNGDDVLRGGAGTDLLIGGAGVDVADYGQAAGAVTASLTTGLASNDGDGGSDSFSGIENLTGSTFNDSLTGNGAANTLSGGAGDDVLSGLNGDDVLRGGRGNDVLNGGAGTDTADYAEATAGVLVRLDLGYAPRDGEGGVDSFVSIENITGSQFNDVIVGNSGANLLRGGLGSDVLLGGAGDDILMGGEIQQNELHGGQGNDYYVLDVSDTVIEYAGEGIDTVESHVSTFTLAANVENLIYTGAASFNGWGNALDNQITGGAANDSLRGMGGNDTIDGGAGTDTLYLRGAQADYAVTVEADGWRIVDSVGGRDGSTFVESIEALYFLTGGTSTVLTYPSSAPAQQEPDAKEEALVIPMIEDDGFVLTALLDDQPLVLPGLGEARSYVGLEAQFSQGDWMLTPDGLDGLSAPGEAVLFAEFVSPPPSGGDWLLTLDEQGGLSGPGGRHDDWM